MPNLLERKMLKDRIVQSISKAVKLIQETQFTASIQGNQADIVFTNSDWQFHKLVEHLDHALLHGLRHITNGYWVVVKDFTHSATVKDIRRLQNVTTNLGRGRAWLYFALSDHLLESYMRCFLDDPKLVHKYYVKEALIQDEMRMQILLTLSAGLEYVTFQLDVDMAYLDLSSHQKIRRSSKVAGNEEEDEGDEKMSLCSMNSSMSQGSNSTPEQAVDVANLSDVSDAIESATTSSQRSFNQRQSPLAMSLDNTSRLDRIASMKPRHSLDSDLLDGSANLEVIRVKVKVKKSAKKRNSKLRASSEPDTESMNADDMDSPASQESGYRSVPESSSPPHLKNFDQMSIASDIIPEVEKSDSTEAERESSLEKTLKAVDSEHENGYVVGEVQNEVQACDAVKTLELEEVLKDEEDLSFYSEKRDTSNMNTSSASCDINTPEVGLSSSNIVESCDTASANEDGRHILSTNQRSPSIADDNSSQSSSEAKDNESVNSAVENLVFSVAMNSDIKWNSPKILSPSREKQEVKTESDSIKVAPDTDNNEDKQIESEKCDKSQSGVSPCDLTSALKSAVSEDFEARVDNNLKLVLMLEVLQNDDEQIIKMYHTSLGHTEGELVYVQLLLTDAALYLLVPGLKTRYKIEAVVTYRELDYVALSLNQQVINVVCTNRRKQVWITTGNQQLTKDVIGHIDNAMRHSEQELGRLSVLDDATTQKIAMRKWASTECPLEMNGVNVLLYSLVHWEDRQPGAREMTAGPSKEGTLLIKTEAYMFGLTGGGWVPGYFVLRNGALLQYTDKHDANPPVMCIQLNLDECGGCRRSRTSDRNHAFEIILADGGTVQLCASTSTETQEWLQCLCQAVSEGMGVRLPNSGLLACCCVLTTTRILLCHEDVQTNFFRTLSAANVTDVTHVLVDAGAPLYCVLVFECEEEEQANKWIFYFNSATEKTHFLDTLTETWHKHFQITLPLNQVEDIAVQKRCRDGLSKLKRKRVM